MISKDLHKQLFPSERVPGPSLLQEEKAKEHLTQWDLLGKTLDALPDVQVDIPNLAGKSILEHFQVLGGEQAGFHLEKAREMAECELPPRPTSWQTGKSAEGWVRYDTRNPTARPQVVEAPSDDALVFDTEVLYKLSDYPVMAAAVSKDYWYSWIAPGLFSHSESQPFLPSKLISLGDPDQVRVVIGHHIAYDRARVREEYRLRPTQLGFIDTMSIHSAVGGLSSQQRPAWLKKKKKDQEEKECPAEVQKSTSSSPDVENMEREDVGSHNSLEKVANGNMTSSFPDVENMEGKDVSSLNSLKKADVNWEDVSSLNSLEKVANLYLGHSLDKSTRDHFATTDVQTILDNFQSLMTYCANDVAATHELFRALLPRFLDKCPHPASFAGMLHMGKGYLPISSDWNDYISQSESKYNEFQSDISQRLATLAESALAKGKDGSWKTDPWLSNLDWEVPAVRMTKPKVKKNGFVTEPARPYRNQRGGDGKPNWYLDLVDKLDKKLWITLSKRITPYLLRLKWKNFPVYWTKSFGWTFVVPKDEQYKLNDNSLRFSSIEQEASRETPYDSRASHDKDHVYYRIPHPGGAGKNCGSPLSKSYISAFENGTLTSQYEAAKHILTLNAQCTYWTSAKQRVLSQFKCWGKDIPEQNVTAANGREYGVILPQSIVMGTVTRRAVEATWMTAANAKKNRIGSELKAQVQAPAGYKIVGADVDSEELWIASLLGDAQFKMHGATAIGFMTLQGTKTQGTDLHTVTGKILGISRDSAKIFNYGRIYGAGLKYAIQLLLQHSPGMDKADAEEKANELYAKTKGQRSTVKNMWQRPGSARRLTPIWHGGSESFMFNQLEKIAVSETPTTPVLGCVIPNSLMPKYVKDKYMTSRVNWAVQSSGVDYLHLLLVSMDYLMRRLHIDGRFMVSIHDEVRYLVKEEQSMLVAFCLQIANLWVRTAFSASVGIHDVPASAAFFSSVDIDHCLRKEVDMDCLTPSNTKPVNVGQSVDVYTVVKEIERWKEENGISDMWGEELLSIAELTCQQTPVPAPAINTPLDDSGSSSERDVDRSTQAAKDIIDVYDAIDNVRLDMQMAADPLDLEVHEQKLNSLARRLRKLLEGGSAANNKRKENKQRMQKEEMEPDEATTDRMRGNDSVQGRAMLASTETKSVTAGPLFGATKAGPQSILGTKNAKVRTPESESCPEDLNHHDTSPAVGPKRAKRGKKAPKAAPLNVTPMITNEDGSFTPSILPKRQVAPV
ncbi:DNA-directed DNA polymerase [Powellomyces hirtus]|uniref:DNA-directed DNA polymerase n=1 Tax=Powellomyces hirtus TaxID=109895 RepID=A0A507EHF0_9FUNG|nr:DNA-directed DNA polymerase [Powellomyces hirtus]